MTSESNFFNFSSDFTIISEHASIFDFARQVLGSSVSFRTEKLFEERLFLFSSIVLLDVSSIKLEHKMQVLSLIEKYKSKVIVIVPFWYKDNFICQILSVCSNFIPFPSDVSQAKQVLLKVVEQSSIYETQRKSVLSDKEFLMYKELDEIEGVSSHIIQLKQQIVHCSKHNYPLLLIGETGTGKTTIAKIIHSISSRKNYKYHHLNISTITENLADSELFGAEKGAYTDAKKRDGIIKSCNKGTLFVDEIATATLSLQSKLLVFMDTGEFYSVGSEQKQVADVRLIFATNENLKLKIMQGGFRKDLYFRMVGETIYVAPLNERPEDIPYIANRIAKQNGCEITQAGIDKLMSVKWAGNVRQLKHCVERACYRGNTQIDSGDLECYN